MSSAIMNVPSEILAAVTFLAFTVAGFAAQVLKLFKRHRLAINGALPPEQVCDGLLPFREVVGVVIFLLFALSGATRTYFDLMLVGTRIPVVILSTIILGFLAHYRLPRARAYFTAALCGIVFLGLMITARTSGIYVASALVANATDFALAGVSVFLLIGKISQARHMWRSKRTAAVSWFREIGTIVKDISGLWYALTVGQELFSVALTHSISIISAGAICLVKAVVEKTFSRLQNFRS